MAEVAETLLALMRSPNESTRLSACREILDRVLGRAAIAIDATHTKGATSHKRQQFSRMVQYLRKSGSVVHKDVVGTPLNLQRGCGSQSVARQALIVGFTGVSLYMKRRVIMSKIFLGAAAIAVTMTMASMPPAWGGFVLRGTYLNGISINGLNLPNGSGAQSSSQELLASTALIAVELPR
jgi:hypothetical protein